MAARLNKRALIGHFYEEVDGNENEMRCKRCNKNVIQKVGTGHGNMEKHLMGKLHADEYRAHCLQQEQLPITAHFSASISPKARTAYEWIDFIVMNNLPISVCENASYRSFSKLSSVSYPTIKKYMRVMMDRIVEKIKSMLPHKFGIVFDGWTDGTSTHYVATFAFYHENGVQKSILLNFAPLLDETDLGSDSYRETFIATLAWYNRLPESVTFLTGDNCAVNRCLADRMHIPLVGCGSHKLNLAIKEWLQPYEPLLNRVQNLMLALNTIKYTKRLRDHDEDPVVGIKRIKVRWTGDARMVARHERLSLRIYQPDFPLHQGDLDEYLLTGGERTQLTRLHPKLEILKRWMIMTQVPDLTILHMRTYFDSIIAHFANDNPAPFTKYLGVQAAIIQNKNFDNGAIKVMRNQINLLAPQEIIALEPFRNVPEVVQVVEPGANDFDQANQLVAIQVALPVEQYPTIKYIPPTSNIVERFFSQMKLIQTNHRRAMLPSTFEEIAFLKFNRHLWDDYAVNLAVNEVENEVV